MKIFQYNDPHEEDGTRWIAAEEQDEADFYAKYEGWEPCGGEILRGAAVGLNAAQLRTMGCDAVLRFQNFYTCPHDGEEWEDTWSSACNDKCPSCNAEIEPYKSVEV
jgi:hypothetical protein